MLITFVVNIDHFSRQLKNIDDFCSKINIVHFIRHL